MDKQQISFKNMDPSPAVEARVRERITKLADLAGDRIVGCQVVIEAPHRRHRQGKLFAVKINLVTPRERIVVSHDGRRDQAHEDVYVAIRDAFDAATRQLEDRVRRRRGEVKTAAEPQPRGRVARLFADHGFIATEDGLEVYFHRNSVAAGRFDKLAIGDAVRLVIAENESRLGPQASTVIAPPARRRRATG